eukprot:5255123-Alexandrium_andersonii.AAC.1
MHVHWFFALVKTRARHGSGSAFAGCNPCSSLLLLAVVEGRRGGIRQRAIRGGAAGGVGAGR